MGLPMSYPRESLMSAPQTTPSTRTEEVRSFAFLTVVMAPALTGAIIVIYGFLVWFYQMFAGPPHA